MDDPVEGTDVAKRTCTIEGCDRPHSGRGWCVHHYGKWRHTGDPTYAAPTQEQRFFAKVDQSGDCWTWTGYIDRDGYAKFYNGTRVDFAHRVAHTMFVGPLDDGQQVDHLCRNRACVKPAHLEAVTAWVNNMRSDSWAAQNAQKAVCANGHRYTPENTYWVPNTGGRMCRQCRRAAEERRTAKRRASRTARAA